MKLIETTKPTQRTFTLELTENELANLAIALGKISPNDIKKTIEDKSWETRYFPNVVYERSYLYDRIVEMFKSPR